MYSLRKLSRSEVEVRKTRNTENRFLGCDAAFCTRFSLKRCIMEDSAFPFKNVPQVWQFSSGAFGHISVLYVTFQRRPLKYCFASTERTAIFDICKNLKAPQEQFRAKLIVLEDASFPKKTTTECRSKRKYRKG